MKKKMVALLLLVSMLACLFSGCGKKETTTPDNKDSSKDVVTENKADDNKKEEEKTEEKEQEYAGGLALPLSDELVELDVVTVWESDIFSDPNEIEGVQAMEKRTNVHINYQTYGQTEMLEKFTLLLNTGEYPDILFPGGTNTYPGGYMQGIDDGVLVDMKDYLQYMPNYMALLDSNPEAKKQAAYDDGEIHGIRVIKGTDTEVVGSAPAFGLTYRADILEAMGEDLPNTVDEWHDLLVKCRDRGMNAACMIESDGGSNISYAWGVNTDWSSNYWQYDYNTGKVAFGPMLDGFDGYLKEMRKWYEEGLIDKNFTAGNYLILGDYTNIETDQNMLICTWFGFASGTYLYDSGMVSNPNVRMEAAPAIVLKEGDKSCTSIVSNPIAQELYVMTTCEDPELAAKWIDYLYSEEGMKYRYYGIEGKSYTYDENGEIVFTDAIINPTDGMTPSQTLSYYAMGSYMGYQNEQAGQKLSLATSAGDSSLIKCQAVWSDIDQTIGLPGGVALSVEEQEVVTQYFTDIKTAVQERMVKYILGEDNTSHEDFVEKLKDYGVEEVVACYQSAVDRYNNR